MKIQRERIHGLGFKDVSTAKASVAKIKKSSSFHAHKIQAAAAASREQEMKLEEAAVYRKYINSMKKKTKKMNEVGLIYKKSIDCNNSKDFLREHTAKEKEKTFVEFLESI